MVRECSFQADLGMAGDGERRWFLCGLHTMKRTGADPG
jgi:hypothetical protein